MLDDSNLVKVWEDGKKEMTIWFQLPINSTEKDDNLSQEGCQQECDMTYTSYLLTTLIYNSSRIIDIAVNRTSILVMVDGEIRAGKKTLSLS